MIIEGDSSAAGAPAHFETQANRDEVARILRSKVFRSSEVHRNLLQYLADKSLAGQGDSLKEYTVGLDVFAKPESYDPRQESVVRMHMARVRQKLAEYYRTEGVDDPVIMDLPKGGFKMTFEPRPIAAEVASPEASAPESIAEPEGRSKRTIALLTGLLAVAICAAAYFGLRLSQVETAGKAAAKTTALSPPTADEWTPELRELWAPIIGSDRPLVVVLATQQASNLTGLATANGAFLLGQFLKDRKQNVYLTGSDELSMPEITMGNVVFLGPMTASRQLSALPVHEEFSLEAGGVRNLHPQKGEEQFFADHTAKPGDVAESYALVTHAPGVNRKGDVLYLSGNHVSSVTAGVEAFTDPVVARAVVMHMRKANGTLPRYYQIVLKIKSMDDTPLEVGYVLHKELMAR